MMRLAAAVIALTAATAHADVCSVAIPRAPDDVRAEIEVWVRAEPRCSVELEVRVVPTEGGYYLFARDQHGRVRERIVPDAQSAGVLVASWVADDSQVRYIEAPPPSVERVPPRVELAPPGLVRPASPRSTRWITVGAMSQVGWPDGKGLRAELDLAQRGAWTLSAVLAGSARSLEVFDASSTGWSSGIFDVTDLMGEAQVTRTTMLGRWQLRFSGAIGLVHTEGEGFIGSDLLKISGTTATGGVSLLVGREIGARWAFTAGPVVTFFQQDLIGEFSGERDGMTTPVARYETQVMAFGGLRRRL